jgi:hypothetical protein
MYEEFILYSQTAGYREGLYVALSGLAMQILLISVIFAVLIKIFRWRHDRKVRVLIDFYIFQIYQDIIRGLLLAVDQKNWNSQSRDLRNKSAGGQDTITAWSYGNLESLLVLAGSILKDESGFHRIFKNSSIDRVETYLEVTNAPLLEVDRLVPWVHGNSKALWDLSKMRALIRALRDKLQNSSDNHSLVDPIQTGFQFGDDVIQVLSIVIEAIATDFQKRRKLVDQTTRGSYFIEKLLFILSGLLWILPARHILLSIAKFRKTQYIDRWSPSIFPKKLKIWREIKGIDEQQAAFNLGLSIKTYHNYEMGYQRPKEAYEIIRILKATQIPAN